MHVETVFLSAYRNSTRRTIAGGIVLFLALGAVSAWLAATDPPTPLARAGLAAMAAGLIGLAWTGLRLAPFLHASFAAAPEGLSIFDRQRKETFLPWSAIGRVKERPILQVIDVYDRSGTRVLSVDVSTCHFETFRAQLLEHAPASAWRRSDVQQEPPR